MTYRVIHMADDPRSGQFAYFRSMADPWAGITIPVDITEFYAALNGRPFFLSFLYALTRAANAVPEFRRRLLDGQVVEFDRCCPSYTAMKSSGVYVYCLVDSGLLPYEEFLTQGKQRQAEALAGDELVETGDPLSNFFVSCVPWLPYTQLKHPSAGPDDSNPRFSWGKFTEQAGRVTLPVTVYVNHALADGWHIAQFYQNLERELSHITEYNKKYNIKE